MAKLKMEVKGNIEGAIKKIEALNAKFKGTNTVKVGLPKGSNAYPDGTSVIMVGSVHEFGSPSKGIPERSYLRSSVLEGKSKYKSMFTKLAKKITGGKMTMPEALSILGQQMQNDVRDKITDLKSPALKGREGNPLVDTGHLRQSIVYEVSDAD